ncbi:unnamed protein product [Pleuronectes platessa]|uniref:Uncharacterized protein n=1 Tax=Pleuronectes platessa TaxID=8262 RepID=A0A9N7Z7N6_PLEPL|nr:unnamed protein product [Pleuronectes platessa]
MEEELDKHFKQLADQFHGPAPVKCRELAFEYAEKNNIPVPANWTEKQCAAVPAIPAAPAASSAPALPAASATLAPDVSPVTIKWSNAGVVDSDELCLPKAHCARLPHPPVGLVQCQCGDDDVMVSALTSTFAGPQQMCPVMSWLLCLGLWVSVTAIQLCQATFYDTIQQHHGTRPGRTTIHMIDSRAALSLVSSPLRHSANGKWRAAPARGISTSGARHTHVVLLLVHMSSADQQWAVLIAGGSLPLRWRARDL